MKMVACKKGEEGSLNWVDDNNRFVGFDYVSCCCEDFGWYIADKVTDNRNDGTEIDELKGYNFVDKEPIDVPLNSDNEGGGCIAFELKKNGVKKSYYLHLYNYHNGYYSHGFQFGKDDKVEHDGSL